MTIKKYINNDSKLNLFFIPGGPGLSSISFEKLISLKEKYSLYFFNPMGTTSDKKEVHNYKALLDEVRTEVMALDNVILCGHSFGGIQAIDITAEMYPNIKGLIVIGSPLSKNAFSSLTTRFEKGLTTQHMEISGKLEEQPTDEIYKEWFHTYRNFYFHPNNADECISTIIDDSVCVKSYSEAIVESADKEDRLIQLKSVAIPKLFIAGENDLVMPPEEAKVESELGGFKLKTIKEAGHFAHFEQPQQTIEVINNFLSKKEKKI